MTGQTILVSGGAGFIGSHLIDNLITNNRIIVIDDLSSGNISNIENHLNNPDFEFVNADITKFQQLDEISSKCDLIIHLAAKVGVGLVVSNPVEVFMNNIQATDKVLKSAYRNDKRILLASSSEIYGKNIRPELREDDLSIIEKPAYSRWIYSLSKISDEYMSYAYKRKGLRVIVMRLFNMIGRRQSPRFGMVVPRFIRMAMTGEPLTVYGDGSQSRTYCNVGDGCKAILLLADMFDEISARENISFNIGGVDEISALRLAEKVIALAGSSSWIKFIPFSELPDGFDDLEMRKPDISLIHNLTGWKPSIALNDTISEIINENKSNSKSFHS